MTLGHPPWPLLLLLGPPLDVSWAQLTTQPHGACGWLDLERSRQEQLAPRGQGGRDQQDCELLGSSGDAVSPAGESDSLSLQRGCFQPLSVEGWSYPRPPVSLLPRRPHRALDSETAVCGSQNREESQAEVGDKLREMTNYPSQHTKLGLGAESWPGEAAHNYHILGVRKFPPLQDLTRS